MDIRKSLSGDLMIFDHGDIDIILSSAQNKVIAFPKEVASDYVYGAQNRLFTYLKKRGLVRKGDGKDVDHINMNPLNNSTKNIRITSSSFNKKRQPPTKRKRV